MQHIGEVLTKRIVPEVFISTWYQVATFVNAWKGFQKSGLFPLSIDGIDRSKLAPSQCTVETPVEQTKLEESLEESMVTSGNTPSISRLSGVESMSTESEDTGTSTTSGLRERVLTFSAPLEINRLPIHTSSQNQKFTHDPVISGTTVSSTFQHLGIPEIKKKTKKINSIRVKLPNALSGEEAIALLEEREKRRVEDEEAKRILFCFFAYI